MLFAVDDPAHAHFAQVKIAFAFTREFIDLEAADPASRARVQREVSLPALTATEEEFDTVALPAGVLFLFLTHLLRPQVTVITLKL